MDPIFMGNYRFNKSRGVKVERRGATPSYIVPQYDPFTGTRGPDLVAPVPVALLDQQIKDLQERIADLQALRNDIDALPPGGQP
jgi:hypothetical protein